MKTDGKAALLSPYVEGIFNFVRVIHEDTEKPDAVLRGVIGLIGDMASAFGPQLKQVLVADWIEALLKSGRSGRGASVQTKEVAKWTKAVCAMCSDDLIGITLDLLPLKKQMVKEVINS